MRGVCDYPQLCTYTLRAELEVAHWLVALRSWRCVLVRQYRARSSDAYQYASIPVHRAKRVEPEVALYAFATYWCAGVLVRIANNEEQLLALYVFVYTGMLAY